MKNQEILQYIPKELLNILFTLKHDQCLPRSQGEIVPVSWINNLIQRDRFNVFNSCELKRISSLITAVFLLQ